MKLGQFFVTLVAIGVAVGVVSWVVRTAPSAFVENVDEENQAPEQSGSDETPKEDDFFTSNPFDLSKPTGAKAVVEEELYNFDRMILGTTQSHEFTIRNEGTAPLKLGRGPSQCKCTISGLKQQEIAPGEQGTVSLEWTPKSLGPFTQGAIVYTNDPDNSEIKVSVEGEMHSEVAFEPNGNWILGTLPTNKDYPFNGLVYSGINADMEVTSVNSSADFIEVTTRPMTQEELDQKQALSGYVLEGVVKAGSKAETINETVKVGTNVEANSEIVFNVTGTRTGPVTFIGRGWFAGRQRLDFGKVKASEGAERKLTMMVKPFDGTIELSDIKIEPNVVKVSLVPENVSAEATRHRYSLRVEVPKGLPPALFSIDKPVEVRAITNHPDLPELKINVAFENISD